MFTKDYDLPSFEELTVPEVKLGTSSLFAGHAQMGQMCYTPFNRFMLCKKEEEDPRKCIQDGKEVTSCAVKFFKMVKKNCLQEFEQYANCIDKSSSDFQLRWCRNTQRVFDKCALEKMNIERPEFDNYAKGQIIETDRPKPKPYSPPEFPDRAVDEIVVDEKTGKKMYKAFLW